VTQKSRVRVLANLVSNCALGSPARGCGHPYVPIGRFGSGATFLMLSVFDHTAHVARVLAVNTAENVRRGRLCQTSLCGTGGGARLSVPLYAPRGDLESAAHRPR